MKILAWLSDPMSAINGIALVEVVATETADVEQMLALVDGDSVGHFGVSVELVGQEGFNVDAWIAEAKRRRRKHGVFWPTGQFGYPNATALRGTTRYYKVFVHRDGVSRALWP